MSKPEMLFAYTAEINFLEVLQASNLLKRDDKWASAMERVRKLKYVHEAWIDHTCIIVVWPETNRADVAERRVKEVIAKATRIINSY